MYHKNQYKPRPEKSTRRTPEISFQSKRKDTLAIETKFPIKPPLGVYCYTAMPFGLKNAGVTYLRAMNAIFHEHMRKTVECYVYDIAVKSRTKGDHIADLKTVFKIMRAHQLKMNPT